MTKIAPRLAIACALSGGPIIGCHVHTSAPPLGPSTIARPGPSVHRVPLSLDGEALEGFLHPSFVGTTWPFEGLVYDAGRDHFTVPGFYAIDRGGNVTFDPEPMTGPAGARTRSAGDLRDALSRHHYPERVIAAVWYGSNEIVVLSARPVPSKPNPHARRLRDVIVVTQLDPATLAVKEFELPIAPGWDARTTLSRFLQSGEIVVAIWVRPRDRSYASIPRTHGSRHATLRIDSRRKVEVIRRGEWHTAGVSARGEVFGVKGRRGGRLVGLDPDGERRFRVALDHRRVSAVYADGVCTLDPAWPAQGATVSCFDRQVRQRWWRFSPASVSDWIVDDAGWVYLVTHPRRGPTPTLVAVDPEGAVAWSLPASPPRGGMMAADDDLCFVTEPPKPRGRSVFTPELVCIGPRHESAASGIERQP